MFTILSLKNGIDNVRGFYSQGINAGLKEKCDISAVFTTNTFQAAPIKHFKRYPKAFKTNFILINSKNANAMTAEEGIKDIDTILNELKIVIQQPKLS